MTSDGTGVIATGGQSMEKIVQPSQNIPQRPKLMKTKPIGGKTPAKYSVSLNKG
jgi:hypothetical protein